jgi:hypothetical protein
MGIRADKGFRDLQTGELYFPSWALEVLDTPKDVITWGMFCRMILRYEHLNSEGIRYKQSKMAADLKMGMTAFHDHYHKLIDIGAITQVMLGKSNNAGAITYLNRVPFENN